jgi:hypothetical protein
MLGVLAAGAFYRDAWIEAAFPLARGRKIHVGGGGCRAPFGREAPVEKATGGS